MRIGSVAWYLERERNDTPWAIVLGLAVAAIAIGLRLVLDRDVGGEQAIFAYPAIILATLLMGARAGIAAGIVCLLTLWYYVIPDRHSFHIADAKAAITLLTYAVVGSALIWAVGTMRVTLRRYRMLTADLEQQIEARTAERNRFWELSREVVTIVDGDGRVVAVNPSFRSLVPDAESRPFIDLVALEDRSAFMRAVGTIDRGESRAFDARIAGPGGIRRIAWSMVRDAHLLYLVGRDFTFEHQCGEQLLQSQKMEVVGQIANGLAHDFGNILSAINMTLHLLRSGRPADDRADALIGTAEKAAALGDAMIERLMSLSRPERSQPDRWPVPALLGDVLPLLRQAAGRRLLVLEIADDLPEIQVDRNRFDMALLNLVINARDATAEDDRLRLCAGSGADGRVDIMVVDHGSGMDAETLSHVTEPFFTTKSPGHGTGLGLAMVRRFATDAGGVLSIESTPGQGTCVRISLPDARPDMTRQADAAG